MWTALEADILDRVYKRLGNQGFPAARFARVLSRVEDDAGRIIRFVSDGEIAPAFPMGDVDAFECQHVEVASLPAGLTFLLSCDKHGTFTLHFIVNGNHRWDNSEESYRLIL